MSDDFVTRLQLQLREAAERESRRGGVARAAAVARWRIVSRPVLVGGTLACALAVVVAVTLSAVRHASPPVEQTLPTGHRLTVVADRALVKQGGAMATGFGAVWANDVGTGELLRIDPRSRRVLARVAVGGEAFPVAGAGAVWATANGRLLRIDPATDRVTARIGLGLGARAFAAPAVVRGVMWVFTPLELMRIDVRHNAIDRRIGLDRQGYQASGYAFDQRLLYVLRADRVLLAFDAATGARISSTRLPVDGSSIGAADGAVLLTTGSEVVAVNVRSGQILWRADASGERVNGGIVADGSVWIHVTPRNGIRDRVLRLDAHDGRVTGSLTLPDFGVAGATPVGDEIWIVSLNGRLVIAR